MEGCRKLEHVGVNVGFTAGSPRWSSALLWGVEVGSGFDGGGAVWVGQVSGVRCRTDWVLRNPGSSQG